MSKLQRWHIFKAFVCIFFVFNIFVGQTNVNKYDIVVTSFVITVIWTKNEQTSWKITLIHFFSVWLSFIVFQRQFWYANLDLNISYLKTFSILYFLFYERSVFLHELYSYFITDKNFFLICINSTERTNHEKGLHWLCLSFFDQLFKIPNTTLLFQIKLSYSTQREY